MVRHGASLLSAGSWPIISKTKDMSHASRAPYHRNPRVKIERWHQTLQETVFYCENYFLPGRLLEHQIRASWKHYLNHCRYHEELEKRSHLPNVLTIGGGDLNPSSNAGKIKAKRSTVDVANIAKRALITHQWLRAKPRFSLFRG